MTEKRKKKTSGSSTELFAYMEERIRLKRQTGKESTADLYRAASNWLKHYRGNTPLAIEAVTASFVADFGAYLEGKKLKTNTVNSYLSSFRAMYNTALRDGKVCPENHPFAGLKLKQQATCKRALLRDVIEKIAQLDLRKEPRLELATDLSLFSFMACGMAFADLARLTQANLRDGEIVYNRRKTGIQIRIGITTGMNSLIQKYASPGNPHLFPLLGHTEEVEHEAYKALLRHHNAALKEVGERLPLPVKLTSYVFRHTWATEALRCNLPIAFISQALGHTSEKTTRFYLDQLSQDTMNQANKQITRLVDRLLAGAG